jgi:hypothetical protein
VFACLALALLLITAGASSRVCVRRWGGTVLIALDRRRTDLVFYGLIGLLAVAVSYLLTGGVG